MNYRHAFHAGNFADILKHAVLLQLLDALLSPNAPLTVIDTHAGAGLYDLKAPGAVRSGEAEAGVRQLARGELPEAFAGLRKALADLNGPGDITVYPGSPWLVMSRLRAGDQYIGCELHPDVFSALGRNLSVSFEARKLLIPADGYVQVQENPLQAGPGQTLVLIDPPFERGDDYDRAALAAARAAASGAIVAVWTPLKDLETFDHFLRRLQGRVSERVLVIEARLRPMTDPMRMNGCAMVVISPPPSIEDSCGIIAEHVVKSLGSPGGLTRLWYLDA